MTKKKLGSKIEGEEYLVLHEFAKKAKEKLPKETWDYLIGASETETTLKRNRFALDNIAFRPRVLRDVENVDLSVKLLSLNVLPSVVVVGFGTMEALVHQYVMKTFSRSMLKAALRGVTIITNAGDSGVSGPLCWCDRGDGFFPMFPASVPFLTSVGGTMAFKDELSDQTIERSCQ